MLYLLAFESTHDAMAAQRALAGSVFAVVPVPPQVRAGCGMAIRFEAATLGEAWELARCAGAPSSELSLYEVTATSGGFGKAYRLLEYNDQESEAR